MASVRIQDEGQVATARRMVQMSAREWGLAEEDAARAAFVARELASHLARYSAEGELLACPVAGAEPGIDIIGLGLGVGSDDLAFRFDNASAGDGSPGAGLGAVARQSAIFDVFMQAENGTAVFSRIRPGRSATKACSPELEIGAVCEPAPGEDVSGDAWKVSFRPDGALVVVADGLGHGPAAADAAEAALRTFDACVLGSPRYVLGEMNADLHGTRGAAIAVAEIDFAREQFSFAGIGNISGVIVEGDVTRRTVSQAGIVGHSPGHARARSYPCTRGTLVILHSDGLATGWDLRAYPGLADKHPAIVAAVLYRDFTRGRDDVAVLVARSPRGA